MIRIKCEIEAPLALVWECWTKPEHITQWNHASEDWHCPYAENDPRTGGAFKYTMAARDGSMSFDFEGVYTAVQVQKTIAYTLGDDRKVEISFLENKGFTTIVETFEPEKTNPPEMQEQGWQAILDNFKKYLKSRVN